MKLGKLVEAIINDIRSDTPVPVISLKFHNTVAEMILRMCRMITEILG